MRAEVIGFGDGPLGPTRRGRRDLHPNTRGACSPGREIMHRKRLMMWDYSVAVAVTRWGSVTAPNWKRNGKVRAMARTSSSTRVDACAPRNKSRRS